MSYLGFDPIDSLTRSREIPYKAALRSFKTDRSVSWFITNGVLW